MTKTCEHCGSVYSRRQWHSEKQWALSRFCSRQCSGKAQWVQPKPKNGKEIPCFECGKLFYLAQWSQKRRGNKFCSQACSWAGRELKATFEKGHADIVPSEARKRAGAKTAVSLTGKKLSPAHCAKIGDAKRGRKLSPEHIRKSLRRRAMSSLEVKMAELIAKHGLPFRFVGNGDFFVGKKNPDFVHSGGKQIAVEVFYRRHKERFSGGLESWMNERREIFASHGWQLVFLNEAQVNSDKVQSALGGV